MKNFLVKYLTKIFKVEHPVSIFEDMDLDKLRLHGNVTLVETSTKECKSSKLTFVSFDEKVKFTQYLKVKGEGAHVPVDLTELKTKLDIALTVEDYKLAQEIQLEIDTKKQQPAE
jgi:hypothetical protein